MRKTTREWVRKAEHDFRGASKLHADKGGLNDLVCFHCQQCIEKYLKALLEETGLNIPRTHDLLRLLVDLQPTCPILVKLRRAFTILSEYAVDVRYPGDQSTKRQASSALRWTIKCRLLLRKTLGLRT